MHTLLIEGMFKPGKKNEFLTIWESQILPTLKTQKGYVDEVLLFRDESMEAVGLSFWKTKADADRYYQEVFPKQTAKVSDMLTGTPKVRGFDVEHAEIFDISERKAA
jgi:heme-degrading monooxygenase HmoA